MSGSNYETVWTEVPMDAVTQYFIKDFELNKPGWKLAEYTPVKSFFDPVKQVFLFKITLQKEKK